MELPKPLFEGKFIKRYKRFFADIQIETGKITAHVPNTGSLKTCLFDEALCYCSFSGDPKRKLKYTLQAIKTPTSWVGVNTQLANELVWEAWLQKSIPHWTKYEQGRREVQVSSDTRFDMTFWQDIPDLNLEKKWPVEIINDHSFHFVEVKNVTFAEQGVAYFPDAVTTRGQKHLRELIKAVDNGHSAEIVFVIQRTDCQQFLPAQHIDPEYAKLLKKAHKKGVRITPYACLIDKNKIQLDINNNIKLFTGTI